MQVTDDSIIIGTAMDERWKGLGASQHGKLNHPDDNTPTSGSEQHVFYKDMRFWLILLMLAAFFAFTLTRFP